MLKFKLFDVVIVNHSVAGIIVGVPPTVFDSTEDACSNDDTTYSVLCVDKFGVFRDGPHNIAQKNIIFDPTAEGNKQTEFTIISNTKDENYDYCGVCPKCKETIYKGRFCSNCGAKTKWQERVVTVRNR